jgi:serine/threonine protein kinase/tetratricopeptide (TPR) repeat protein
MDVPRLENGGETNLMNHDSVWWNKVEEAYHAARELSGDERTRFLDSACGLDTDLRQQVAVLLKQDENPDSFLNTRSIREKLDDASANAIPSSASEQTTGKVETASGLTAGTKLGPYQILGPLGEGGMGKVFRARDTRLGRSVAIKISASEFSKRFESEARTISALNHPNICSLYDIGSLASGAGYMVTELVEGETLSNWLKGLPAVESRMEIARQVLEALRAAHGAGIVHRDLTPANIMVRFDGYAKVLDFGLAKRLPGTSVLNTQEAATTGVSIPGQIMGTSAYMSPEQILGEEVGHQSDLFTFGIILYEMLAGRHPWRGNSTVDTLHAILHDDPAPIQTPFARVVMKLLRKNPDERYPSAEAVLKALASPGLGFEPRSRAVTRLMVLPFRILRADETTDFLSLSLPDAITSSLTAIDSLVVRSMMVASRFGATPDIDVKAIAEQVQVDAIVTGTILSDGGHLRVNAQLIDASDGAVRWSKISEVPLRDVFQVQDELVDRIVQSLALPLTPREERALKSDVPASPTAYEWYLRANQLAAAGAVSNMIQARDLYLRCVNLDPKYAPAWARLGRAHRMIGKFKHETGDLLRAEEAFRKAFTLNSELALAHNFYTVHECDLGRSLDSVERLLMRAQSHANDPNLFAGLVHACRYGDLLEASVRAHERARRLDPEVPTSVPWTHLNLGNFETVLKSFGPGDGLSWVFALVGLGRRQEAMERLKQYEKTSPRKEKMPYASAWYAHFEGDNAEALELLDEAMERVPLHKHDPEARFRFAEMLAIFDRPERALEFLSLALDEGYRCHYSLLNHHCWDSLRSDGRFESILKRAADMSRYARTVFLDNGGNRLLGGHVDARLPEDSGRSFLPAATHAQSSSLE